jgi:transcriptional regulator GlxA family with amidase domain
MVRGLGEGSRTEPSVGGHHHSKIIARLEEFLVANHDRAVYLAEICAAIGVSERTLRICCEEHLGMGPIRHLWLRRMHLARRALVLADPAESTVTDVACAYGFWEFGRFSVDYRTLFGERPSVTLHRPRPAGGLAPEVRPFALAATEFA